jgi:hypothetical protein
MTEDDLEQLAHGAATGHANRKLQGIAQVGQQLPTFLSGALWVSEATYMIEVAK